MSATIPPLIDDDGVTLLHLTKPSDESQSQSPSASASASTSQSPSSPDQSKEQALTVHSFQDLSSRFIEDITSPICSQSHDDFWKSLIASLHELGFVNYVEQTQTHTGPSSISISRRSTSSVNNNAIDFESSEGKAHLDAVTSLLGVSIAHAKTLTTNVLENLVRKSNTSTSSNQQRASSSSSSEDEPISKLSQQQQLLLLGTKKLLVSVQEYHYNQQLSRIRFIAESLRREKADDVNNDYIKTSCEEFLNQLDERTTILVSRISNSNKSGGGGGGSSGYSRGLLKVLLCIACAPMKTLDRDQLYKSVELSGDGFSTAENDEYENMNSRSISISIFNAKSGAGAVQTSKSQSKSSQEQFARSIMEKHKTHYDSTLRTEALEALFMLLYTRIHGGISRGDYTLLLLAFDRQHFYSIPQHSHHMTQQQVNVNRNANRSRSDFSPPLASSSARRRSQLTSLILAECMSLWHATNNNGMTLESSSANIEWIEIHPFLSGNDSNLIFSELNLIGKLLFEKHELRWQALTSQRIAIGIGGSDGSGFDMTKSSEEQRLDVEAPESIAMLTFGLLLKIAYNSGRSTTATTVTNGPFWASQPSINELATQCVSLANDQCGAFEYLGNIMTNFLHEPPSFGELKKKHQQYTDYEWREDMLRQAAQSATGGNSPSKTSNGTMIGYLNDNAFEEDGTIISYASIGREILVGTLCAFRSTIRVSNKENVKTLCELASKIYRNNDALCANFWSDWTSESQSRDQNGSSIMDPMCLLLDVAYQIANHAVSTDIETNGNFDSTPLHFGKFAASILPDLQPVLSFISSLIPRDGDMVHQILEAFLSNGIIHASLIGCLHLCSTDDASMIVHQTSSYHQNLLQAAMVVMSSLSKISSLIQEDDSKSASFMREAFAPRSNGRNNILWQGSGVQLLHKIATSANDKLLHKMEISAHHNVDFDINISSHIVSFSLNTITSLLQFRTTDDIVWIDHLVKCFTRKDGDMSSFARSGISRVTSSCMHLLYTMSCNLSAVIMSQASHNDTVLSYLKVINNGIILVCELISSRKLTIDLQCQETTTLCHCLWTLQTLLKSSNGIALNHANEDVKSATKDLRGLIVESLSSSTALGTVIGFYATSPISCMLTQTMKRRGDHGVGRVDSETRHQGEGRKHEGYCALLETMLYPNQLQSNFNVGLRDLCAAALSVLVAWGQATEQIALSDEISLTFEASIEDCEDLLSSEQLDGLSRRLTSVGPSRLLLSLAEPPFSLKDILFTDWQENGLSILALISKFVGWSIDCNGQQFDELAIKALDLIVMSLRHSNIAPLQNQRVFKIVLGEETVKCIGSQINIALEYALNQAPTISGTKKNSVLLHLLDLLKSSISLQPLLAKEIILGRSDISSLLESKLLVAEPNTLEEVLISEACAAVVHRLWKSCREHCGSAEALSTKFHPCDEIIHLLSKKDVYKHIVANLSGYHELLGNGLPLQEDCHLNKTSMIRYKRSKTLQIFTFCVEIVTIELMLHLRNKKSHLPETVESFLVSLCDSKALTNWFKLLTYDSIVAQAIANNRFVERLPSSNMTLSKSAVFCPLGAINIINDISDESYLKNEVDNLLRSINASRQLAIVQGKVISSLSTFGEIFYIFNQGKHLPVLFSQVEQIAALFSNVTKSFSAALSLLPLTSHHSIISDTAKVSGPLIGYLFSSLSTIARACSNQSSQILGILEAILNPCEVIFESIQNSLESKLRSYIMTSLSLAIDAVHRDERKLLPEEEKRFCRSRMRCCRLACETLQLLKAVSSANKNQMDQEQAYLLETAIACMALLIPTHNELSLSSQTYQEDLTNTLRNCDAIPLIIFHLKGVSESASIRGNSDVNENNFFLGTIAAILNLTSLLVESGNAAVTQLLLDHYFINSLTVNPVLLNMSKSWTSSPQVDKPDMRGYSQKNQLRSSTTGGRQVDNKRTKSLHDIWRCTLRTIACLTHSTNLSVSQDLLTSHSCERCTFAVIEFVRTFEVNIFVLLDYFQKIPEQTTSLETTASRFRYNLAFLNEACDALALLSELCSRGHKKTFEARESRLFQKVSAAAMQVVISLSSFLGAIGTARELFSLLNGLNQLIDNDSDSMLETMRQKLASHPLLAEGINHGRHEAIKHALYASKCWVCVTQDEYALSQSESSIKSIAASSNVPQSFQNQIQNDFVLSIESICGQCMFNALSVLRQVHPAILSFVPFSEAEAAQLSLTSIPQKGTLVAIRPKRNHGNEILAHLNDPSKFARIVDFNTIAKTLDVVYTEHISERVERDVNLSRLAGIEDITKRNNLFLFRAAPKSIAEASRVDEGIGSVGHLIQTLRWCRQHDSTKNGRSVYFISKELVKCIAEATLLLLGDEMSLHNEMNRSSSEMAPHEVQNINRQIFDLFLYEQDDLLQIDSVNLNNMATTSTRGLQRLVDDGIWKSVKKQVSRSLAAVEKEIILRNAEPTESTVGWVRGKTATTNLHNSRRSPFK